MVFGRPEIYSIACICGVSHPCVSNTPMQFFGTVAKGYISVECRVNKLGAHTLITPVIHMSKKINEIKYHRKTTMKDGERKHNWRVEQQSDAIFESGKKKEEAGLNENTC